jgi:hypothetical protein
MTSEVIMKRILTLLTLLAVFSLSCKQTTEPSSDPNVIGGDVNIALNTVGNDFTPSVSVGDTGLMLRDTIYVTSNNNGFVTYKVWADLKDFPALRAIIPASRLDAAGNLNTTVHLKMTSEGIQDFRLSDSDWSKPFTIVKYDCKVGDKWTFKTKDGQTVTREVTSKSTTDDTPYGFLLIKANVTEETPVNDLNGVSKIKYVTNHKFGLAKIILTLANGKELRITLYPTFY